MAPPHGLQDDAARIISQWLGQAVEDTQVIRRGVMTFKCLVTTVESKKFIVRFYPPGRENVLNCEPDLLARCHRAGVPVPLVVADARGGPRADLAYIVYHWTEGAPLVEVLPQLSAAQQEILGRELASCLYDLRRVEFQGYGELVTAGAAADASWRLFVRRSFDAGLEALAEHRLVDPSLLGRLRGLAERVHGIEDWRPRQLIWGDISFGNILVNSSGRLAGLIDFESCLSGDPLATIGYCYSAHGDQSLWAALFRAWPDVLDDAAQERVFLYAILRCLRLARYAHLPLPTGHPRDPLLQIFPGFEPAIDTLTNRS